MVSDIPGTTRDSIDTPMKYHGTDLIFIDTAGLRRQSRLEDGIEFYSSLRTRKAIERSDICILMLDATEGEVQNQDLKIAALAWESGRGLIVVVNKWDIAEKDDKAAANINTMMATTLVRNFCIWVMNYSWSTLKRVDVSNDVVDGTLVRQRGADGAHLRTQRVARVRATQTFLEVA